MWSISRGAPPKYGAGGVRKKLTIMSKTSIILETEGALWIIFSNDCMRVHLYRKKAWCKKSLNHSHRLWAARLFQYGEREISQALSSFRRCANPHAPSLYHQGNVRHARKLLNAQPWESFLGVVRVTRVLGGLGDGNQWPATRVVRCRHT